MKTKKIQKALNAANHMAMFLKPVINVNGRDEILPSYYSNENNKTIVYVSRLNEDYVHGKEEVYVFQNHGKFLTSIDTNLAFIEYAMVEVPKNCFFIVTNSTIKGENKKTYLDFDTLFAIDKDGKVFAFAYETSDSLFNILGIEIPEVLKVRLNDAIVWHKVIE